MPLRYPVEVECVARSEGDLLTPPFLIYPKWKCANPTDSVNVYLSIRPSEINGTYSFDFQTILKSN